MKLRNLRIKTLARRMGITVSSATEKVEKLEAAGVGFEVVYAHLMGNPATGNSLSKWMS